MFLETFKGECLKQSIVAAILDFSTFLSSFVKNDAILDFTFQFPVYVNQLLICIIVTLRRRKG